MYLQDIVISPDIFEKINKAHDINSNIDIDFRSYRENLNLKKLVLDSNSDNEGSKLLNKINQILQTANDVGRNKIDSILKTFLESSNKIQFVHIDEIKKYSRKDDLLNIVLNLTNKTENKIVNTEDERLKLLVNIENELNQIEILNFEESIYPKANSKSKVFVNQKKIKIKQGEIFKFEEYFFPYLQDTKNLTVKDRYLRNRNRGFLNLCKIITLCPATQILINTKYKDGEHDHFDISIENFKEELETRYENKTFTVQGYNRHIRTIITDKFEITIDPGLDFVNQEYIADKNDVIIEFSKREDIVSNNFNY